jgi:hypothetical protein
MAWVRNRVFSASTGLTAEIECGEGSPHVHLSFVAAVEGQDHFVLTAGHEGNYRGFLKKVDEAIIVVRGAAILLHAMSDEMMCTVRDLARLIEPARQVGLGMSFLGRPIDPRAFLPGNEQLVYQALDLLVGQGLVEQSLADPRNPTSLEIYRRRKEP